jgi:ABC-type multidrug transport system ATPase subunit
VLLATHHLDDAERHCDRIGIMEEGRLAASGTVEELADMLPRPPRWSRCHAPAAGLAGPHRRHQHVYGEPMGRSPRDR